MVRLRKIENAGLKARDIVVLYAIHGQAGMMGREIAQKLGYAHRSQLQDGLNRLTRGGYIEDHRKTHDQQTPNDFHITPAGKILIADIVPA